MLQAVIEVAKLRSDRGQWGLGSGKAAKVESRKPLLLCPRAVDILPLAIADRFWLALMKPVRYPR